MSEKAGEVAREDAQYRCERCHQTQHFAKGALIPPCPHCGFETYDLSNPRFEDREGRLGAHEPG